MMQCSDKLGLSLELGSFAAGVMISTTDLAQHTLEQVILCLYLLCSFCLVGFASFLEVQRAATNWFGLSFTALVKFIARLL